MNSSTFYLSLIDTDTPGARYDVTPLFADPAAFSDLVNDLLIRCQQLNYNCIAAIDALGFLLGGALAHEIKKPLVPVRKGGKLPVAVLREHFVDYTGLEKALEIRADALKAGMQVLVVDEWIETGAQVRAAIRLIERSGARVAGVAAINVDHNEQTASLIEKYSVISLSRDL